ncbi:MULTISPECIES: 5-(carboxyamino)imidazole ribonucleotide synthase [unclassified Sphingobium]|uniref:5-(carboxyamino)imidazole ribonucleotide synthase n=1 Tax=unclassified Sphingobium TaxID=2611147 RepID=UPI0022254E3D|nr:MULTISPECIES: 5-(carboxyamino)imidazole ribonucleotide synthase [unclassified Sphingobium]MCW2382680.1 5-(carboxyamino)imidazole ribonucleotide synthase [Sphingobium sp. B2D3B]MCW2397147.1 5-(carboxyamino)imidazole ribonucleotide synthase [Sphingobium sp. B2D3C]
MTIAPGSTIGIVGGGQLGRMIGMAAIQLGYRVHIFAPEESGPASDIASAWTQAPYEDDAALTAFADAVDIITYEFENVPSNAVALLAKLGHVRPNARALAVAQDRLLEKSFVAGLGGRTAPYAPVSSGAVLQDAIARIGAPAILKTTRFGYDGKGQVRLMNAAPETLDSAWNAIGCNPAVLEGFVTFDHEFSVVLVRGQDGTVRFWDSPHNVHVDGILATSTLPAPAVVLAQVPEARAIAARVAQALEYVGVLTLEFFAGAAGPIFNEMAPRVHNSGHWTIEGAVTSQFENHVRAVCGLPLGSTALAAPAVSMQNLIGDEANEWQAILADETAHLHLYGKNEARPGRKMGHVTRVQTSDSAA